MIGRYLNLPERFKLQIVPAENALVNAGFVQGAVTYVDHTGKFISTKVIAKKLAALVNLDELLLGDGAAEENEISKHFDVWQSASLGDLVEHYNDHLKDWTFLESEHLTCADLIVFCQLHNHILDLPDVEKFQKNNLLRWFNHIQHLPRIHQILREIGRDFVIYPVEVSKKDLKNAEKKAKKATGEFNPRNPKAQAGENPAAPVDGAAKEQKAPKQQAPAQPKQQPAAKPQQAAAKK